MLTVVQDGKLRPRGCVLSAQGADDESRGDEEATLRTDE